jgi:hypothetical protein
MRPEPKEAGTKVDTDKPEKPEKRNSEERLLK